MQSSVYSRGKREDAGWILLLGVPIGALITVFYKFRKCEKPKPNKSAGCLKIVSQHLNTGANFSISICSDYYVSYQVIFCLLLQQMSV